MSQETVITMDDLLEIVLELTQSGYDQSNGYRAGYQAALLDLMRLVKERAEAKALSIRSKPGH